MSHYTVVEVKDAVLTDFDGKKVEVSGGVWLSPDEYLRSHHQLEQLKEKHAERERSLVPVLIGAALLGAAVGYWLGRRGDDD
jgi:hypothetical protein